jgi:hypothetical protein
MKSWDFLENASCATDLVNAEVQQRGYQKLPQEERAPLVAN